MDNTNLSSSCVDRFRTLPRDLFRIGAAACALSLLMHPNLHAAGPASAGVRPLIVAHRGASFDAPENTLAAFREAWSQDADAIEGDFLLTSDNRIVCIHDKRTKRTGDQDLEIKGSALDDLRTVDVGAWKDVKFRGESIPTLSEVLETVPSGRLILIEIKCGPEIVPTLETEIARTTLAADQIHFIAFDAEVIAAVKRAMPEIKAFWLTSYRKDRDTGVWSPSMEEVFDTLDRIGADGLDTNANREVVDSDFVSGLRDRGYEFHVWTVDDPEVARHFVELGVDSITTNRPEFLRDQLGLGRDGNGPGQ